MSVHDSDRGPERRAVHRRPRQLFINGQWIDAASGKTFETPNPATGATLANIAEGDAEDIESPRRACPTAW
jgi:acyl-CoA reductase-like NAD-dependent aldehyde dehydrogenase